MFNNLVELVDKEVSGGSLDKGSLTQSLTLILNNSMTKTNPQSMQNQSDDVEAGNDFAQNKEDQESDKKLGNIEIELEEIAQGVRDNL